MEHIFIDEKRFEINQEALTMISMNVYNYQVEYLGELPRYLILSADIYISMCCLLAEQKYKDFLNFNPLRNFILHFWRNIMIAIGYATVQIVGTYERDENGEEIRF